MSPITKPTVLITGCTTGGIGHALAHAFHTRGYHVFATARNPTTVGDLSSLTDTHILPLDVTIPSSIASCLATVTSLTGGTLDILVNNAGTELVAPLLSVDLAQARAVFEVNVWGVLAVTQAFAPLIIAAKGVVTNQSSIDACLNMAFSGIFASSKSATLRLSEILKVELAPLGVRVVTLVTGSADTPLFDHPLGQLDLPADSPYHVAQATANAERAQHRTKATNVDVLARAIVKDLVSKGTVGPVWHGAMAALVRYMSWLLPTSWLDGMVNAERGIGLVGKKA